jgi:hypothetical protein
MAAILTIPENDRRERFIASGGQTTGFTFDYPVYEPEHLAVFRLRGTTETVLVYGADYTVAGAGDQAGGSVTLLTGATAGDVIVVKSDQPAARTTSFANGGDLTAEALNAEFNRICIEFQELDDAVSRTVRLADSDLAATMQLPPANVRANGVFAFDADGNVAILQPDLSGSITDSYLQLLVTNAVNTVFPREIVVPFAGSLANIPTGWQLCDGTNGTPDLRDKFIVAAGPVRTAGSTGGAASVTSSGGGGHDHGGVTQQTALTVGQLPPHNHQTEWTQYGEGGGTGRPFVVADGFGANLSGTELSGSGEGHSHPITAAGNHTHTVATLPPYYALAFIARTGVFVAPGDPNAPVPISQAALYADMTIAVGDETTAITTGTAIISFRMLRDRLLDGLRITLNTASSSGIVTVDVNVNGATILSTKLTIDVSELTSKTAAVPAVLTTASIADDALVTIDIDVAGTGAAGLKAHFLMRYAT